METYKTIILALGAYFIGSISFSYIFTKKLTDKDIRNIDIKNAGAFNVFLNVGKRIGTIVGVLDGLKTLLIVLIGKLIGLGVVNTIIAASFGIIGHCFPIFHNFYGGRGAASVIGIFIYFIPLELLISIIPAVLIGFIIHKMGTTPVFFIAFSPIVAYISNKPPALVFAIVYVTLLTGIMNLIIIFAKRDHKVIAE
ncbi:MAG: glycerol-3-phosphate acyltransferase [Candidatus Cloacimonetes bacterium]|nr:glycerol-3-phosphate acyltransferase [Candidatus Cloacimonadota bacterium]MBL7085641.1 glycerol-3-phosphate acyltransferase [Candidatus Cloacimonadota bacterium]